MHGYGIGRWAVLEKSIYPSSINNVTNHDLSDLSFFCQNKTRWDTLAKRVTTGVSELFGF